MNERHVVCVQQRLTHYRERLFDDLRHTLARRGITFDLVHGQPDGAAMKKRDAGVLTWAHAIENRYIALGSQTAVWQSLPQQLTAPDLIILTQENKLLANYGWLIRRRFQQTRVAYWGHGRNFQADRPNNLRERWKRMLVGQVDWWFAYTDLTRDILREDGYPEERITVLDNAIDNEGFQADLADCSPEQLAAVCGELGIGDNASVGLFCGSLYADKRLQEMIAAADRIHAALPAFHLIVVGDGPDAGVIHDASASRPWLHAVGVRKGPEKARYFRLADIVINPGAVGLHVLDAFCAGTPMATMADSRHGPEIAYLRNGENSLVAEGNPTAYADGVIALLTDTARYRRMQDSAHADANRYTLANMSERFAQGIEKCLATPKKA